MGIWSFNLRHLVALASIVRLGSLSATARSVALTQPALTQGLARLEDQIGQRLFERRAAGMVPLPAALLLAPRIETAMAHIGNRRVTMAQVKALIAVADGGSYAAASALAGLAPPSLHRSISDLGLTLGRPLVERRGRGLVLTASGRQNARRFRLARAELLAGLVEVSALVGPVTGKLVIGAMPLARARLLPMAIAALHRQHPDVVISVIEGSHTELIEPLRDGEIAMMIGALRPSGPGPDLAEQALLRDRPVVVARAQHPLAAGRPTVADLARFPWVLTGPQTPLRSQWHAMFASAGVALPPVPVESGSVMVIRGLLLNGDFLTLLSPDQVAVEIDAGLLVQVAEMPAGLGRTIGVTTRADWRPTTPQRDFIDLLQTVAASELQHNL